MVARQESAAMEPKGTTSARASATGPTFMEEFIVARWFAGRLATASRLRRPALCPERGAGSKKSQTKAIRYV